MTIRNATLRQLKVFETVARLLSFSRAAEELHLTQPAVSTQVAQLEDHAGLPLFEQLGKKIYLTPAGAEMLQFSRTILQQFQQEDEAMSQLKGISGGTLNVAVISAGDYFFPRLLAEFTRRHAGVTFNLSVHNREELLHQLSTNQTDLAVMVRPPAGMDVVNEPFAPHPYVIVAAPTHPLAGKRFISMDQLTQESFIVRERGSDTWNSMQDGLGGRLDHLKIAMEIKSTETIKQAVIAGMGIAFLSGHTISLELQVGHLVVLDVERFPVMLNWYVVHRKNKRLPPVAEAFKRFLIEEGAAQLEKITRVSALTAKLAPSS
ncbi:MULTISPECIES: LysR family transcriptional regulator [unclassified Trinickia]|jgi:DNA-binding transcriptional LysR family regulator|uniref:LysR family transcriptional regulator n=1 Tax=unclassified Trinickia TaxID=2638168 RepID=UPI002405CB7C|nr:MULTISPECIES: LysR family transcriptional regulator [unclassified Trinickia]MDG0024054.1 LysR family transcriptional regulator [Trinickia sp. Y13]HVW49102.1 LysR family transcriptional regulator [Trinickia sp.]